MAALRGDSWGMNLQTEDEINNHQQMMDRQDEKAMLDDEAIEALDIEKILETGKFSDKQKAQLTKITFLRQKLLKTMDKKQNFEKAQDLEFDDSTKKGQVSQMDKRGRELTEQLQREEETVKQMLRDKMDNEMF